MVSTDLSLSRDRAHPFKGSWTWPVALVFFLIATIAIPRFGNDYLFDAVLTPFLALSLATLGLNILTGYTGQLSLGSAAFMAVGTFAAYNFQLRIPALSLPVTFVLAGLTSAVIGIIFGLPSLRLRGFYLAVSTLAAQFFVQWALTKFGWFSNDNPSGVITAPSLSVGGIAIDTAAKRYLLSLGIVAILTLIAARLVRNRTGRSFLAIRDNELAAKIIGVRILQTKLLAFAISSFYVGIAGALWAFAYLRTVEPAGFDLNRSFQILFMIIIGGLASIRGSFLGAAFLVILPLVLSRLGAATGFDSGILEIIEKIILGVLIIGFLIIEPDGLSALLDRVWHAIRNQSRSA